MNSFTVNLNAQICVTIMSTPDHMREADLSATNERSIRAILEEVFLSASTLCTVLLFIDFSLFLLSICFIKWFGNLLFKLSSSQHLMTGETLSFLTQISGTWDRSVNKCFYTLVHHCWITSYKCSSKRHNREISDREELENSISIYSSVYETQLNWRLFSGWQRIYQPSNHWNFDPTITGLCSRGGA